MLTDEEAAAIEATYTPETIPPCRLCGRELTPHRSGPDGCWWACDGETGRDEGGRAVYADGRACADQHFSDSHYRQRRYGDENIAALLADRRERIEREARLIAEARGRCTVRHVEPGVAPDAQREPVECAQAPTCCATHLHRALAEARRQGANEAASRLRRIAKDGRESIVVTDCEKCAVLDETLTDVENDARAIEAEAARFEAGGKEGA